MGRGVWPVLLCLLVAGCATGAPPTPAITDFPATAAVTQAGGVPLRDFGYRNAPADLMVPAGARITEAVDQPNNVVAVFDKPAGAVIAAFLRAGLPAQGWVITADGDDSLLFERGAVTGAFTVTGELSALTIRSDPRS